MITVQIHLEVNMKVQIHNLLQVRVGISEIKAINSQYI